MCAPLEKIFASRQHQLFFKNLIKWNSSFYDHTMISILTWETCPSTTTSIRGAAAKWWSELINRSTVAGSNTSWTIPAKLQYPRHNLTISWPASWPKRGRRRLFRLGIFQRQTMCFRNLTANIRFFPSINLIKKGLMDIEEDSINQSRTLITSNRAKRSNDLSTTSAEKDPSKDIGNDPVVPPLSYNHSLTSSEKGLRNIEKVIW